MCAVRKVHEQSFCMHLYCKEILYVRCEMASFHPFKSKIIAQSLN